MPDLMNQEIPNPPVVQENKRWPWVVAAIFVLLVIGSFMNGGKGKSSVNETDKSVVSEKAFQIPPEVKSFEIVVTSQIVKKVDGKYRYFFDIRNNDKPNFNGTLEISVINKLGKEVFYDVFDLSSAPIAPQVSKSVYFDANTGPEAIHGDNGIVKFSYKVKIGNVVVKTGEGDISTKVEDLTR